jgi:hypothetical protein
MANTNDSADAILSAPEYVTSGEPIGDYLNKPQGEVVFGAPGAAIPPGGIKIH